MFRDGGRRGADRSPPLSVTIRRPTVLKLENLASRRSEGPQAMGEIFSLRGTAPNWLGSYDLQWRMALREQLQLKSMRFGSGPMDALMRARLFEHAGTREPRL